MVRAALLIAALGALFVAPAAASASPGRLVVLTGAGADRDPGAAASVVAAAMARSGAEPDGPVVPQLGLTTVRPRAGESLATLATRLRRQPGVVVERERRMTLRALPNDPALHEPDPSAGQPNSALLPGTPTEWWLLRAGFPGAWPIEDGAGATVAVIDTGVDSTHPDLAPKLERTVDQEGRGGHVESDMTDTSGHGTHVASLACAATGNGLGIAGAGDRCRLIVEQTDLTDASIAASIVDATDHGAQAINMSFGDDGDGSASATITRAIAYAVHRNVVLVAAAADRPVVEQGDPANVLQPTGTGPQLGSGIGLSVTAADETGERAPFAGFGSQISLAAYGAAGRPGTLPVGLIGAFPSGSTTFERGPTPCGCRTSIDGDTRYGYLAGTSMAAPQVAATAALVRTLNPDLRARDVVRLLKQTARRPAGTGWTSDLGWGLLDPRHALLAARRIDRGAPVSKLVEARRENASQVALRWTASDPAPPTVVSSGVRDVELWARRIGNGPAKLVLRTTRRAFTFTGVPGARYAFFTRAADRAGNREPVPTHADAVVALTRRPVAIAASAAAR